MQSLTQRFSELQEFIDPVAKSQLTAQVQGLTEMWNAIEHTVQQRTIALEQAVTQRAEFHNKWADFEQWLVQTQKEIDRTSEVYSSDVPEVLENVKVFLCYIIY